MGRPLTDDPLFFEAPLAAGAFVASPGYRPSTTNARSLAAGGFLKDGAEQSAMAIAVKPETPAAPADSGADARFSP